MEIYIFLGFGIVLAIIIALIFIKDSETNKKFTRYERAIESAIQENYNLKKQLAALASFKPDDDEQLKDVKDELKEQIKRDINEARQCVGVCDLFFGETMRYFDGYGAGI